jgi:hypothetical protein
MRKKSPELHKNGSDLNGIFLDPFGETQTAAPAETVSFGTTGVSETQDNEIGQPVDARPITGVNHGC